MKRKLQHMALLSGLLLLATGCSKDPHTGGGPEGPGTARFTLELEVPGASEMDSKALSADEERYIETLDLLLFYVDNDTERFDRRYAIDETDIDQTGHLKKFDILLPTGTGKQYRMALFANARPQVEAAATAGKLVADEPKEDVMAAIGTFAIGPAGWDVATPAYIPMWAENEHPQTINNNTVFTTFQLVRALARFDLTLSEAAQEKLELLTVAFYNYAGEGHPAPEPDHYSHAAEKAVEPSVTGITLATGLLEYTASSVTGLEGDIYAAEYKNLGKATAEKSHLLIRATELASGQPKWYKIDLVDSRTGMELDILRNFLYQITINTATGSGYDTPEEAIADDTGAPLNADVIPWRKGYIEEGISGRYYLDIPKTNFEFDADGRGVYQSNTGPVLMRSHETDDFYFEVYTNYPGNWQVTKVLDSDGNIIPEKDRWVTIKRDYFMVGLSEDYQAIMEERGYIALEVNTGSEKRYARVFIAAGPLEYVVHVTQDYLAGCGTDGNYGTLTVGGRDYKTHVFVDHHVFRMIRCWMVENLTYIPPQYPNQDYIIKQYNALVENNSRIPEEGERGYYYSISKMDSRGINPCPEGWRLPEYARESMSLIQALSGTHYALDITKINESMPAYQRALFEDPENNPLYAGYIQHTISTNDFLYRTWATTDIYNRNVFPFVGFSPYENALALGGFSITEQDPYFPGITYWGGSSYLGSINDPNVDFYSPVRCVKEMDNKTVN